MKYIILASALALAQGAIAASERYVTLPIERRINHAVQVTPESLTARYLQRRATADSLPLTNANHDVLYTTPVQIGNPPQTFNLAIDTGSPVTWVSSSTCLSVACQRVNKYDCARSTTCRPTGQVFEANYVDGSKASGTYYQETYTLGAIKFSGIAGIVTSNNAQLPKGIDGIMGLWYYGQGVDVPVLDRMKKTAVLSREIMGVYMKSSDQSAGSLAPNQGGEVTFGGINTARFTGELTFIDNVGPAPWTIPLGGVSVNGKAIPIKNATAILDTGTTAFLVPEADADAINGAIPGAQKVVENQLWALPCSKPYPKTTMTLTFGGFSADVPYEDLILESTATATPLGPYCVSTVMYPGNSMNQLDSWLIGDAFLKNVFSVYDFSNTAPKGRIGLAKLAPNQPPAGGGSLYSGEDNVSGGGGSDSGSGHGNVGNTPSNDGIRISSSATSWMGFAAVVGSTLLAMLV